jgi:hypothetical protein
VLSVTVIVLAIPMASAPILGTSHVAAGLGRLLPAFVTAEAANDPTLGTLEVTAQPDGGLGVLLHRGAGTTLDAQSTLAATAISSNEEQKRLATLAGNLASRSGFDSASELGALNIGFVLAPDSGVANSGTANSGAANSGVANSPAAGSAVAGAAPAPSAAETATRVRTGEALDANPEFTAIGETANGFLWSFDGKRDAKNIPQPAPFATPLGTLILSGQILVLLMTILLAAPTTSRSRGRTSGIPTGEPAATFEGDDNG